MCGLGALPSNDARSSGVASRALAPRPIGHSLVTREEGTRVDCSEEAARRGRLDLGLDGGSARRLDGCTAGGSASAARARKTLGGAPHHTGDAVGVRQLRVWAEIEVRSDDSWYNRRNKRAYE